MWQLDIRHGDIKKKKVAILWRSNQKLWWSRTQSADFHENRNRKWGKEQKQVKVCFSVIGHGTKAAPWHFPCVNLSARPWQWIHVGGYNNAPMVTKITREVSVKCKQEFPNAADLMTPVNALNEQRVSKNRSRGWGNKKKKMTDLLLWCVGAYLPSVQRRLWRSPESCWPCPSSPCRRLSSSLPSSDVPGIPPTSSDHCRGKMHKECTVVTRALW